MNGTTWYRKITILVARIRQVKNTAIKLAESLDRSIRTKDNPTLPYPTAVENVRKAKPHV